MIYLLLELFVSVILIALALAAYSIFAGMVAFAILVGMASDNLPADTTDKVMILATVFVCLAICRVLWVGYKRAREIEKARGHAK